MVLPRFVINSFRQLREDIHVLRSQVQLALRSAVTLGGAPAYVARGWLNGPEPIALERSTLLNDAVELFESADGFLDAHRVADLDRAGQCFLGLHRLERFEVP